MENDLADRLDDLICAFDAGFDSTSGNLDSIVIVLVGWVVLAFCIFMLVKYLFKTNQSSQDGILVDEIDSKKEELAEPIKNGTSNHGPTIKVEPEVAKIGTPPSKEKDTNSSSTTQTKIATENLTVPVITERPVSAPNTPLLNGSSSRMTNGHSEEPKKEAVPAKDVPKSLGSDEDAVAWVNEGLVKAFTDEEISRELIRMWLNSLSQYTKSSGSEDGVAVEFRKIEKIANPFKISNIITQTHPGDNMTITADLVVSSLHLAGNLIYSLVENTEESHEVRLQLDQMRGRINLSVLSRERWLIIRFDGWPEVKARLVPEPYDSERRSKDQMFKNICDVAKDLCVSAIRGAQVNINMEEFVHPYEDVSVFPAFVRGQKRNSINPLSSPEQPLKLRPPPPIPTQAKTPPTIPKKEPVNTFTHELKIRVVKAMQLGMTTSSTTANLSLRPYVIVEIDEPGQRGRTESVDISSDPTGTPHWNQEFDFNLTERSGEVLFEVWDASECENIKTYPSPRDGFLGLGIVSIEELMITSSQRLVLPLQGRPYYNDDDVDVVNGLLMVQFDMVDMIRRKRAKRRFQKRKSDQYSMGQDSIPATELEEIPGPEVYTDTDALCYDDNSMNSADESERGRRRKPKRTLVSTLKKRLSTYTPGAAKRSSSVQLHSNSDQNNQTGVWRSISQFFSGPRSVSADRSAKPFSPNTVASARSFLTVPRNGDDASSMSDMSGISSASAKTYIAEESSLVIECLEKGQTKHYMIPYVIAERGNIRKKGTKLHIYMDHIFVAKRVKGGTLCEVCSRRLPISLGKQGYVCRDCSLTCHKPCHIKIEGHCEQTSLPAMELQFYDESQTL